MNTSDSLASALEPRTTHEMNRTEKTVTMLVAVVGAIAGLWGAYAAHQATRLRHPLEEHEQMARSFHGQILSAEKRNDAKEVIRIRLDYERFEEGWRRARRIALMVAPVEALAGTKISANQTEALASLVKTLPDELNYGVSDRTLGAAYLAIGDYETAARHLTAASTGRDDPKALALRSAAFGELANAAQKESERSQYAELAAESFRAALNSPSANVTELSGFAKINAALEGILATHGVEMTTRSTKEQRSER